MRSPARLALGRQLAIELFGCDSAVLDDTAAILRHTLGAAAACGATVVGKSVHRFSPHGVSCVVVLAESHLALHSWPEHRYAAVDLFTCGTAVRPRRAVAHLRQALRAEAVEVTAVPRGPRRRARTVASALPRRRR